jgi:choice-of-anchor B domain-containing protein
MRLLLLLLLLPASLLAQLNLQQIGHLPYAPLSLAGCWHHVDSSGVEYALVGTSAGLSIVDLSDPTQPKERFVVNSLTNNWREVKTWKGFAYFGSEAQGSGITIVDLRSLPDTVYSKVWFGTGFVVDSINRSHALQAEDGYLYVFGGGNITNGATIASLEDPWNPVVVSKYSEQYVHDGFIRGDTLWTSEIYKGWFGVVDIADRNNPILLATQPTPGAFNHNSGLSPDSKVLFTTDEKPNTPLASFDVTDLDNITLLDTYFPSQLPSKEVHNVRVLGDFLVNPSYGGQLTIVDATRPDNLIETAWTIMGNSLVWDADPYLPSGIVFATAKNEGLFIYKATYQHAAWLEGKIFNASTGLPLNGAKIALLNTPNGDSTKVSGTYKTGAASSGTYSVEVSKTGFFTQNIDIALTSGQLTLQDFYLSPFLCDTANLEIPYNGVDEDCDDLDALYLSLPPYVYALEGVPTALVFRNHFLSKHPQDYLISVETDLDGTIFSDRWAWTGTDTAGEYPLRLRVRNAAGTILEEDTTVFRVARAVPPTALDTFRTVLAGNSFFNQGWMPSFLQMLTDTLTRQLVTYHGTNASWLPPLTRHEGYGGTTGQWFAQDPASPFIMGGTGLDAAKLYDQIICPGCSPDWLFIQVDINEFCNNNLVTGQDIPALEARVQADWDVNLIPLVNHLKTVTPDMKIVLCIAPPASARQEAFAQVFPNDPVLQERFRWQKIVNRLEYLYRKNFESSDTLGIYLLSEKIGFEDLLHYDNTDCVHPNPSGYRTIAQNLYAWMRWAMQPEPVVVNPPSAVDDLHENMGLTLFPNPANNRVVFIGKSGQADIEEIALFDDFGRLLARYDGDSTWKGMPIRVELPTTFSGVYRVRAKGASGTCWLNGLCLPK